MPIRILFCGSLPSQPKSPELLPTLKAGLLLSAAFSTTPSATIRSDRSKLCMQVFRSAERSPVAGWVDQVVFVFQFPVASIIDLRIDNDGTNDPGQSNHKLAVTSPRRNRAARSTI